MMIDLTYQMVLSTLQTAGLLVGIFYYIMTLRNQQKTQEMQLETRKAQLFMQIYNRFTEVEFRENFNEVLNREWVDYDDYNKKYGRFTNPSAQAKSSSIALFFEGLGILLQKGFLDVDIVGRLMSTPIRIYWVKFYPIFNEMRATVGNEEVMEYAEYLYDGVEKRFKQKGISEKILNPYETEPAT
jgi:hypothetical protein